MENYHRYRCFDVNDAHERMNDPNPQLWNMMRQHFDHINPKNRSNLFSLKRSITHKWHCLMRFLFFIQVFGLLR